MGRPSQTHVRQRSPVSDFLGAFGAAGHGFAQSVARRQLLSRGQVIIAARSGLVFFVRRICKIAANFLLTRAMLSSAYGGGPIMRLPGNARLESTLYFKSPSLGEIMFIDVDVTPDEDGEVELLPEGIAELTARWCVALNRMRKVRDFRPATREEVPVCVQRHNSVNPGRAHAMSMRRLARATSAPRGASANGVRYRLRELSGRYFGMPQRAFEAFRSRPRSRWPA
jgi:hypothetical protein